MSPKMFRSVSAAMRELGSQSLDAFGAGANVPAQAGAEKGMFLFAFETEPFDFLIQGGEVSGFLQAFRFTFRQSWALATESAHAMKFGDDFPIDIALGIKGPISRNVDHGAVRRDIDGEFERQRLVVLHSIEIPVLTKRIKRGLKNLIFPPQVDGECRSQVTFNAHAAANHSFVVAVGRNIENLFNLRPLAAEFRMGADSEFILRVLGLSFYEARVIANLNLEFVFGHRGADGFIWRRR